jgi:hypothetical protein
MPQTAAQRRFVRTAGAMNKKAARLGSPGRLSAADLGRAFVRSGGECPYCRIGITPDQCSFDHIVPFETGGHNTPENLTACCMTCQREKASRSVEDFMLARTLSVQCSVCGTSFKPRFADYQRGYGTTCSRSCAGTIGGRVTKK